MEVWSACPAVKKRPLIKRLHSSAPRGCAKETVLRIFVQR